MAVSFAEEPDTDLAAPVPPRPEVSVVVPIVDKDGDPSRLYELFSAELRLLGKSFEFLFVVDGGKQHVLPQLEELRRRAEDRIEILCLERPFGEGTALAVGFGRARGEIIVTTASFFQVQPSEIGKALAPVERGEADVVVGRRYPRLGGVLNRAQAYVFHWILSQVTRTRFHDVTGSFRAMRRRVARELDLYGDLYRFLPILAVNRGFSVREVKMRQHQEDRPRRIHGPMPLLRRLLDLLTVFFLTRFTQRPLRFFGMIGLAVGGIGSAFTLYLGIYRLLDLGSIGDKPLLLLGVLLLVLGVQSISIGLLGEIIIFTHGKRIKEYKIVEDLHS